MAMDIKIDKDIPVPPRDNQRSKFAHVVRALGVGDSFWLPKDSVGKGFPASVKNLANLIGIKVVIRTVKQEDVIGWRVWRVEDPNVQQLRPVKGATR